MPPAFRRLLALIPLLAGLGAQAAGLGEIEVASHLGEPLRVTIPLSLEEGTLPADQCIRIVGPSRRQHDLALATVDVVSRNGRHFVAISTRQAVKEPMLDLTLRADGCGLSLQKDYVIMLSPAGFDVAPPAVAVPTVTTPPEAAPKKPARSSRIKKSYPHTAGKTRRSGKKPLSRHAVPAEALNLPNRQPAEPAPASKPPEGNRLVLTAPELETPPASEPAPHAATKTMPGSERNGLVTNVEGTVAKPAPAAPSWLPYLLAAMALIVLAGALAWWLTRRQGPRALRPGTTPSLDTIEPDLQELSLPSRPLRSVPAAPEAPSVAPASRPAAQPTPAPVPAARPAPAPLDFDLDGPGTGGIEANTIQPADVLAEQPASIDHVMELAEVMLAFGRSGQAIEALSQHIHDNPRQSVDPWLKLLDLYHQSDLRNEYDALAANLHKHYNVAITEWADYATGPDAKLLTLESLPHIMARLTETWGTQAGLDYLDKLLADNRGGQRMGFSLALVRDILLLRGVLRQIGPGPVPTH
ncbi:MAG: hypothetical protein HGA75_06025 [Thiobacillus sp.]|nr:hypothetical protein [Thiobacillus sp.]